MDFFNIHARLSALQGLQQHITMWNLVRLSTIFPSFSVPEKTATMSAEIFMRPRGVTVFNRMNYTEMEQIEYRAGFALNDARLVTPSLRLWNAVDVAQELITGYQNLVLYEPTADALAFLKPDLRYIRIIRLGFDKPKVCAFLLRDVFKRLGPALLHADLHGDQFEDFLQFGEWALTCGQSWGPKTCVTFTVPSSEDVLAFLEHNLKAISDAAFPFQLRIEMEPSPVLSGPPDPTTASPLLKLMLRYFTSPYPFEHFDVAIFFHNQDFRFIRKAKLNHRKQE